VTRAPSTISVRKARADSALTFAVWVTGIVLAGLTYLAPSPAMAYIGPGAGLTAIGSLLALIAGILLAIVGFVWYPIRRLRRRMRARKGALAAEKSKDPPPQ